jgi:hypothetical protein
MQFKTETSYSTLSVSDQDIIWSFKIRKRTEKTVSIVSPIGRSRRKIHKDGDCEFIYPTGNRYARPLVLRADKIS